MNELHREGRWAIGRDNGAWTVYQIVTLKDGKEAKQNQGWYTSLEMATRRLCERLSDVRAANLGDWVGQYADAVQRLTRALEQATGKERVQNG